MFLHRTISREARAVLDEYRTRRNPKNKTFWISELYSRAWLVWNSGSNMHRQVFREFRKPQVATNWLQYVNQWLSMWNTGDNIWDRGEDFMVCLEEIGRNPFLSSKDIHFWGDIKTSNILCVWPMTLYDPLTLSIVLGSKQTSVEVTG